MTRSGAGRIDARGLPEPRLETGASVRSIARLRLTCHSAMAELVRAIFAPFRAVSN